MSQIKKTIEKQLGSAKLIRKFYFINAQENSYYIIKMAFIHYLKKQYLS